MKRIRTFCFIIVLCISLCACSHEKGAVTPPAEQSTGNIITADQTPAEETASEPTQTFPFEDGESRTRYRLIINNSEVETENYPFTKLNESKNGYYPLEDVLRYLGVECLCSEDERTLTTKINGNVLVVMAEVAEMTYGATSVTAQDANITPVVVNGVLYVPGFFFMSLSDNTVVDFSGDRSAATLDTDVVVNQETSGTADLSIGSENQTGSNNGDTRQVCERCAGIGNCNVPYFDQVLVNGQWKQIPKTRWQICPNCGGSGYK